MRDSNGFVHRLMHTQTQRVRVGDRVATGDLIGTMGNTGTQDQHVHYQLEDRVGNVIDPTAFWDQQRLTDPNPSRPPYLDESMRVAQIMSGGNANPPSGSAPPIWQANPFSSSFGNSTPNSAIVAPPLAPRAPNWFDGRFGKWGSTPTAAAPPAASNAPANFDERFGNWGSSPASGAGDGGFPAAAVSPRAQTQPAPPPVLGLVSGQPMRFDIPPSIFGLLDKSSSTSDDDLA